MRSERGALGFRVVPGESNLGAVCAIALALAPACIDGGGSVQIDPEHVIYEGEAYGDFLILGDAVRDCMESDKPGLPRIVLADAPFICYTTAGWKTVVGCTAEDESFLFAPVLLASEGSLWSHELTHYFGSHTENNACGSLALRDFSLAQPDAGR